jgi:hypothetical protein
MFVFQNMQIPPSGVDQICCVAGLIYVECCLRDISPRSRIVRELVTRLSGLIENLTEHLQGRVSHDQIMNLSLWSIVVGGSATKNTEEQRQFVKWLVPY